MSYNNYKRGAPTRIANDKVLVLCSGETEKIYFNHFKQQYKDELSNVSVRVLKHKRSNPMSVVERAVLEKDKYIEVWCVFDKDIFPDFDAAIEKTEQHDNIHCAFSNEAVEYWFLLHYENRTGAMSRGQLNSLLQQKLGFEYNKNADVINRLCFELDKLDLSETEQRAQIGHECHIRDNSGRYSDWCSCTTVYMLTKRLREWSAARKG